jgi:hypothetical protein
LLHHNNDIYDFGFTMIWRSVLNGYPEVETKCEVLVNEESGDLIQMMADYDPYIKMFIMITDDDNKCGKRSYVSHWRAL